MPSTFGIVDLFAGPGGLGEGFASLVEDGHAPFRIGISVEKEASAHRTLTLRAFLREYRARHGVLPKEFIDFHAGLASEPDWSAVDAEAWKHAIDEARALELGTGAAATAIDGAIATLKRKYDDTILIGGPPCQAYSLVGRVRSRGKVGYVPEEDARHYLFREYIRVLDKLRPAAFVMENVKGMLSSTVESRLVFEMLMEDLSSLGTGHAHHYELRAIRVEDGKGSLQDAAQPSDFIVRADAVDVLDALRDQHLALARDASAIFVLGARRLHHGADPRLAALEGEQGPDQRLAVEPVSLRPAPAARCRDRGGIDDMALNPLAHEGAVDPETIEPGFLDHDDWESTSGTRLRLLPELREARHQAGDVTAENRMVRHLLAAARQERGDGPARTAEFQRDEYCAKIGADGGRFGGAVGRGLHSWLQSGWSDEQPHSVSEPAVVYLAMGSCSVWDDSSRRNRPDRMGRWRTGSPARPSSGGAEWNAKAALLVLIAQSSQYWV